MSCPCCKPPESLNDDQRSVLASCRYIAEQALANSVGGGVVILLHPDGTEAGLIEYGNARRYPYSVAGAARRVAARFNWLDPELI